MVGSCCQTSELQVFVGNYEGHLRNDNGQTDPGISSLFDFTAGDFNLLGDQFQVGPLNTDRRFISEYLWQLLVQQRPHNAWRWFPEWFESRRWFAHGVGQSNQRVSADPPVYLNAGEIPVGGRGKLGRTPFYTSLICMRIIRLPSMNE